jgi:coenzyme F420-0:L-glutamate ligase / coenzyme F420-1:gamma-L-glutamate ligase
MFAVWAPSAHNRQPWRFCVVTSREMKERLAAVMGERWAEDLRADGVDEATIERRVAASRARMSSAAALVAAALSMEDMDTYPDQRRCEAERTMAVQSTALACQNLLLAAHAYGLGACWMCAPLFAPELVRKTLELPEAWQPQALVTLGYAAEERVSEREPLAERVVWR